jgi:hypothetical protein
MTERTFFILTLASGHAKISAMNKLEESLNKIADQILYLDEASLTSLWEKYKNKMENFSFSPDWERSVIIFSVINAFRVKNAIFNEQMVKKQTDKTQAPSPPKKEKPNLRLVK